MSTTAAARSSVLVSAKEADDLFKNKSAVPLDASWHMPNSPANAKQDFFEKHIPGARFWSHDDIASEHPLKLPHMLPTPEIFAKACAEHGITNDSHVVVYDSQGCFSAPRALWTFQTFGHKNVYLLNGGLPRWIAEGFPTEAGESKVSPASYDVPAVQGNPVRSYEDMIRNNEGEASKERELVLDARPAGRFDGSSPEPRPGLSSGHMPYAVSLPFGQLLTTSQTEPKYTMLLPREQLKSVIEKIVGGPEKLQAVLDGKITPVGTCGSGMTAAIIALAMKEIGAPDFGLYDESWMGYAQRQDAPIVKS